MSDYSHKSSKKSAAPANVSDGAAHANQAQDEQILESASFGRTVGMAHDVPVNPNNVMRMQALIGNRATLQLLRQTQPTKSSTPFRFITPAIQREAHPLEAIPSSSKDTKPEQPVDKDKKLNSVYINAWEVMWQEFKPKCENISHRLKGSTVSVAPLKGRERATQKVETDYEGDTTSLVDIARASLVCKTPQQVLDAWELVNSEFTVVRVKNRFANPVGGYRDLMLNVALSNKHVAELQIHLEGMLEAKEYGGHQLYDIVRDLEAKKNRTSEEDKKLADTKQQMQAFYDEAWEKAKAIPEK
jgi:hypothetical protein